jgi:HAD superfamily hydrolase (TIGR01457 family)
MLADRYDCLLFDLDGVLYRGDEAVAAAPATMAELRRRGARLVFITNNSSATAGQIAVKLRSLGIDADPAEVVTSALATADLLAERDGGSAFAIGGPGVVEALAAAGLRVLDGRPEHADVVVVGIDQDLTYAKLRTACLLIRRGARFVATNADLTFPAPGGDLWPGAGALVAAIRATTGVEPEIVGKPFAPLFEAALRRGGGGRPLVIGDRLDTDIEGAGRLGWDSLLVLSGVSSQAEIVSTGTRPTFVGADVSTLLADPPARAGPPALRGILAVEDLPGGTSMVVQEVRKAVGGATKAVGGATDRLSASGAQELARSLMQGQGKEQISKAAQEILRWSTRSRERLVEFVRAEVSSQLKSIGVATREEVDALRKRVRELERAQGGRPAAKRSTAKRRTAKRSPTTGSTAGRVSTKPPETAASAGPAEDRPAPPMVPGASATGEQA